MCVNNRKQLMKFCKIERMLKESLYIYNYLNEYFWMNSKIGKSAIISKSHYFEMVEHRQAIKYS